MRGILPNGGRPTAPASADHAYFSPEGNVTVWTVHSATPKDTISQSDLTMRAEQGKSAMTVRRLQRRICQRKECVQRTFNISCQAFSGALRSRCGLNAPVRQSISFRMLSVHRFSKQLHDQIRRSAATRHVYVALVIRWAACTCAVASADLLYRTKCELIVSCCTVARYATHYVHHLILFFPCRHPGSMMVMNIGRWMPAQR